MGLAVIISAFHYPPISTIQFSEWKIKDLINKTSWDIFKSLHPRGNRSIWSVRPLLSSIVPCNRPN